MTLNDCRDEAGAFLKAVGADEEDMSKILGWLDEEQAGLKDAADRNDLPVLRHQIYDVLFLLFELAARFDLDLDAEWAAVRERKRVKYLKGKGQPWRLRSERSARSSRDRRFMKQYLIKLSDVQPSQLYISVAKLEALHPAVGASAPSSVEPVPIKRLGDDVVYTDGHTRAMAAHLAGMKEIPAVWDEDDLDWEAYEICVRWCKEEGIRTVADLASRIVDEEDYEKLWLARCRKMHDELARDRKERGSNHGN